MIREHAGSYASDRIMRTGRGKEYAVEQSRTKGNGGWS